MYNWLARRSHKQHSHDIEFTECHITQSPMFSLPRDNHGTIAAMPLSLVIPLALQTLRGDDEGLPLQTVRTDGALLPPFLWPVLGYASQNLDGFTQAHLISENTAMWSMRSILPTQHPSHPDELMMIKGSLEVRQRPFAILCLASAMAKGLGCFCQQMMISHGLRVIVVQIIPENLELLGLSQAA
jgi:hypothetical protein